MAFIIMQLGNSNKRHLLLGNGNKNLNNNSEKGVYG